jgi:hypothetical protein
LFIPHVGFFSCASDPAHVARGSHPAPFRDPRTTSTAFLFDKHLNDTRTVGFFSSVLMMVEWPPYFQFSVDNTHEISSIVSAPDYNFGRYARNANFRFTRINDATRIHSREV